MPSPNVTSELDFSRLRVLVVGDLMLDRYLHGQVERISPEAPVPIVGLQRREDRLGGAANVALNLRALGIWAGVAGAVGADASGKLLRHALTEQRIDHRALIEDPGRPTTVKTRVVAQDQQLLRLDEEVTDDLSAGIQGILTDRLDEALAAGRYDVLILQDYNKGVLNADTIASVLQLAAAYTIPVIVDPKRTNFWAYTGVRLFKPNLREVRQQLDFPVSTTQTDLDRAAAVCFERLGCETVMITLSEHGIYTHDGRHSAIHPTRARRITDVSGAGDTVISVVAGGMGVGMRLVDIARLANLAGARVIAQPGVVAIDGGALLEDWREGR